MYTWISRIFLRKKKDNLSTGSVKQETLSPREIAEHHKQQGNKFFSTDDLASAEACYRQSILADISYAEAYNNLGLVQLHQSHLTEAQHFLEQAIHLDPKLANAHYNLSLVFKAQHASGSAIEHLKTALALKPIFENASLELAFLYYALGDIASARQVILDGLSRNPNLAEFHLFLGSLHIEAGDTEHAITCYLKAVALAPNNPNAHYNLGATLHKQDKLKGAISSYRTALSLNPNFVDAHVNLGSVLKTFGQLDEAITHYQKAIQIKPDFAEAHYNLGTIYLDQYRMDECSASCRQAILHKPDYADAYTNLGLALKNQGRIVDSIVNFRKALAIQPNHPGWHSNLLLAMQYATSYSSLELFNEHSNYAQRFEAPLKAYWQPHSNNRDPLRRLKIGYVSGDFRSHSMSYFIRPILANHDKTKIEVYCYYNHKIHDSHTDKIAAVADHWINCIELTDEALSQKIRADGIDILVDLSGHTAYNRLPVFARKPAPVQVTWLGYQATTGLTAMDYRLTDPSMDPIGTTEQYHSETLIRMVSAGQFQPAVESPPVNDLPALSSNKFTLSCLNNLAKINQDVIHLWSRILHELPHSQLILGNASGLETKQGLIDMFSVEGIAVERLIFMPRLSLVDYLSLHHEIDLALDTFPYNGGTTTFHSLWMGVPVVALAGNTPLSRAGVSAMLGAGYPEFCVNSADEYVSKTIEFSKDLSRLNEIRHALRNNLTTLFAHDPVCMTRDLENTYRIIWNKWCNT